MNRKQKNELALLRGNIAAGKPVGIDLTVDPDLARVLLKLNKGNRKIRQMVVDDYARQMRDGEWYQGPGSEPIMIDENNELANGQHRLSAVAEAGVKVQFRFELNVPVEARRFIDLQAKRSFADNITLSGGGRVGNKHVAIIRAVYEFGVMHNNRRLSILETEDLIELNREALDDVTGWMKSGAKGVNAHVAGEAMKAWYHEDHEMLERFVKVLKTGMHSGQHESAAVLLRNFLLKNLEKMRDKAFQMEIKAKTASAIHSYCRGRMITQLCEKGRTLYPVPMPKERGKR